MSTIVLRRAVEIEDPVGLARRFLGMSAAFDTLDGSGPESFDERDLRLANRGGARISAAEIAGVLERRGEIEAALRAIRPDASLAAGTRSVPWAELTRLFDAFGELRGVGLAKTTKALHRKRPALVPMLDSVVRRYLADEAAAPAAGTFGEQAVALVRAYKVDLDRNRAALATIRRELARDGHRLSEVRILDIVIWSTFAAP